MYHLKINLDQIGSKTPYLKLCLFVFFYYNTVCLKNHEKKRLRGNISKKYKRRLCTKQQQKIPLISTYTYFVFKEQGYFT